MFKVDTLSFYECHQEKIPNKQNYQQVSAILLM